MLLDLSTIWKIKCLREKKYLTESFTETKELTVKISYYVD